MTLGPKSCDQSPRQRGQEGTRGEELREEGTGAGGVWPQVQGRLEAGGPNPFLALP